MTDVAIPTSDVFQRFLKAADEGRFEQNPDQVAIDIIARILSANDAAEVLGGGSATHAKDYLDKPFTLTGLKLNKSDFDGVGPDFYAVLEGVDADGVEIQVTCGAKNVMAQAWRLDDLGALPCPVVIRQSTKSTSSGFHVMWLEQAPSGF